MTGVTPLGRARPPPPVARRTRPGGTAFTVPDVAQPEHAAAAKAASEIALSGLLSLQAGAADDVLDRASRRRGAELLDTLERLQTGVLNGTDTAATLSRLAALTADIPQAVSAPLRAVVDAIGLRAMVELAKWSAE